LPSPPLRDPSCRRFLPVASGRHLHGALLPALIFGALARPSHAAGEPRAVNPGAGAVSFQESLLNMGVGPKPDISRFEQPHAVLPGRYMSHIVLNGEWRARIELRMADTPEQPGVQPCFERDMLERIGIALAKLDDAVPEAAAHKPVPATGEFCGPLAEYVPGASASFDGSDQTLNLSVPQLYVRRDARGYVDPKYWDAGIKAGVIGYQAYLYRHRSRSSDARLSGYVGINASASLGSWHLSHLSSFSWTEGRRRHYDTAANYLQHDLPGLASQLYVGDLYPYQLAAWRLRGHLRSDRGDLWTRAANYHSRTPRHNARYRAQLMHKAWRWNQWLGRQFTTHMVDDVTAHRHGETGVADVPDSGDAA